VPVDPIGWVLRLFGPVRV